MDAESLGSLPAVTDTQFVMVLLNVINITLSALKAFGLHADSLAYLGLLCFSVRLSN